MGEELAHGRPKSKAPDAINKTAHPKLLKYWEAGETGVLVPPPAVMGLGQGRGPALEEDHAQLQP